MVALDVAPIVYLSDEVPPEPTPKRLFPGGVGKINVVPAAIAQPPELITDTPGEINSNLIKLTIMTHR